MAMDTTLLCLCSSSPTRAKLLDQFGIAYTQKPVAFDEDHINTDDPYTFVYQASKGKLEAAERIYGLETPLLTADSVVVAADGAILRKAYTVEEAREILLRQSGSEIAIVSSLHFKTDAFLLVDTSATHYRFDPFDADALEGYLASRDWEGKAGACMVEGFCRPYIREVRGRESTAMGLQVEVLLPWLEERGLGDRG